MIIRVHERSLVGIIIVGFLFQAFGFANLFVPQIPQAPNSALIKNPKQTRHTSVLAKRMTPGTGAISGTVSSTDVQVSTISVSVIDTFGCDVADVMCDLTGNFMVTDLYPGAYLVMAYINYQAQYLLNGPGITFLGNTTSLGNARWVRIVQGQALTGQNIVFSPAAQQKISISGTCYAGAGTTKPMPNIGIAFSFISANNQASLLSMYSYGSGYCFTGSSGAYACTASVAPGNYYVKVGISSYYSDSSFISQWWDGSPITAEPTISAIGSSTSGKDIHLTLGGTISGVVKDPAADSLLSFVSVYIIDKDGYYLGQGYCEAMDTTFSINGLPQGSYTLKVSDNKGSYETMYYSQASRPDSATSISVAAGAAVDNIRIILKRAQTAPGGPKGYIKGKITRQDNGAAVPNSDVSISTGSDPFFIGSTTMTDSLGNFSDSVVGDSSFYVHAGPSIVLATGGTPDYYLSQSWYPGVTDMTLATKVKIPQGQTVTVNISVPQGGSIAGWVRTSANAGFPSYMQSLYQTGDMVYGYAWTDDFHNISSSFVQDLSGFRFYGLAPGSYTVRFISYSYVGNNFSLVQTNHGYTTVKAVAVTKENSAFGQVLTMPDGSVSITGTVGMDPQRSQSDQVSVVYCYAADSILAGLAERVSYISSAVQNSSRGLFFSHDDSPASTQTQWTFALGKLVPGKYALARMELDTTSMAYYRKWYGTDSWEKLDLTPVSTFYKNFLKPNIPSTTWITLADGETKSGINFGNVGVVNPFNARDAQNPQLSVIHNRGASILMHFRLPTLDKNGFGSLAIYRLDGARIKSFALNEREGFVAWDRSTDGNSPAATGVYLFRLTGAGRAIVEKSAILK